MKVWDNLNSKPNNELGSKDVLISEFMEGYWANIGFHSTISVIDTFYVGYEVYYNNPVDTFATFIAEDRGTTGTNTAYVFSNSWKQFNEISSLNTAFGFDILLCNFVGVNELKNKSFDFKIFPNPANNILNIVSSENQNLNVNIYNLLGKNVYSENSITPISKINISDLPNGMYIISVVSENSQISKRIVISR